LHGTGNNEHPNRDAANDDKLRDVHQHQRLAAREHEPAERRAHYDNETMIRSIGGRRGVRDPPCERPEAQDGLGVDLRDTAFSEPEGRGDLRQAKVLEVIHRQNLPWHVGKLLDALHDQLHQFLLLERGAGGGLRLVGDNIMQ